MGQWLGRATEKADAVDWLTVVEAVAIKPSTTATNGLKWTPLDSLTSSDAALEYQQWAVAKALATSDLPSVPGPFGHLRWLDEVRCWVEKSAGVVDHIIPYRFGSYEIVLGFSGPRRRRFIKGLSCDRVTEPKVTMALATIAPQSFARTLALHSLPDGAVWWLMEGCPGVSLAQDPTLRSAIRVAEECARLQQRLSNREVADLPVLDLEAACGWATGLLHETCENDADQSCATIERAFHEVSGCVPHGWIPLDLDPGNVLLDRDAVRFIDLDDSYVGPAPLAVATLVRRIRRSRSGLADVAAGEALQNAYVMAWPLARRPRVRWATVDLVSRVLEDYLGWLRVVKMSERGEVHGLLDLARQGIVRRLTRAAIRAGSVS